MVLRVHDCFAVWFSGLWHFVFLRWIPEFRRECVTYFFNMEVVLKRPRRRWEDNIKMDLQEVGVGRGDWMELAQDRDRWRALVGTVRDFRVP